MSPRKKNRAPTRKGRSGRGKGFGSQGLKLALAALSLLAFLVVSLFLLSLWRETLRTPPPVAVSSTEPDREDVRVELESALWRGGFSAAGLEPWQEGDASTLTVKGGFPSAETVEDWRRRLRELSPDLVLSTRPHSSEIVVAWRDEPRFLLRFRPANPVPPSQKRPTVAIIMDDLGRDLSYAKRLLELDLQVTVAVLPGEPHAAKVAEMASRQGRDVLVHIPMEPQGYPVTDPGSDALFVGQSPEEVRRRFSGFLARVPQAIGGNNHMGSRFTEDREGMATVLSIMKERGLFFVDSLTSSRSVGMDEARRNGVPAVDRDIFLDNIADADQIRREIRKLAALAVRQGQAVAICHPHSQTLEALGLEAPFLHSQGIEVVPVSRLLQNGR